MGKYVVETDQGKFEVQTEEPDEVHPALPGIGESVTPSSMAETASKIYTPVLKYGGAMLGGAIATPGDVLSGPVATAAGGALGYAGGKALANSIDRFTGVQQPLTPKEVLPETAGAIKEGVQNEATGLATGAVIGKAAEGVGNALRSKTAGKIASFFSGKNPTLYKRLANDPAAILPSAMGGPKPIGQAGEELGQATGSMGVTKSLNPNPDHSGTVNRAWAKITEDIPTNLPEKDQIQAINDNVKRLSPQETYDTYNSLKKIIKAQVQDKDPELMRARVILQNALKDRLGSLSGEYAQASKDFARSALRGDFSSIFPTTKYGTPSIGRAGFASAILGKAALPISSPLIHGLLTAGGSAGAQAIQKMMSIPELAPVVGAAINSYIQNGGSESMSDFKSAGGQSKIQEEGPKGFSAILQRARQRQSGEVSDEGLNDFVNKSPIGTKFRYQGRQQKVVPAKTRNTAGLSKDKLSALLSAKRLNRGRNTFAPA